MNVRDLHGESVEKIIPEVYFFLIELLRLHWIFCVQGDVLDFKNL